MHSGDMAPLGSLLLGSFESGGRPGLLKSLPALQYLHSKNLLQNLYYLKLLASSYSDNTWATTTTVISSLCLN